MLTGNRFSRSTVLPVLLAMLMLCGSSSHVAAQVESKGAFLANIAKSVVLDPTTYASAVVSYDATARDWKTSQPFFQHGYFEKNARFTISGRPNDLPVSYGEGNHRILMDTLGNLQVAIVNNVVDRIVERTLVEKYPDHRKIVRTLAFVERAAFASYMSYVLSAQHYRQWQDNERLARTMGY